MEGDDTATGLNRLKKWVTGWMVTTIVVPLLMLVVAIIIANYWNRPQLSISIAKALVGSERKVHSDGVHEYRTVVDLQTPCVAWLVEHTAESERIMPPPLEPVRPRIVYGIYLQNLGRSELTNIRLAFRARSSGQFEITGTPQLALSQTDAIDPGGQGIRTVTIASMAPHSAGVIVGALPFEGSVTIEQGAAAQHIVKYELGDTDHAPATNTHVRFAGASQLSDVSLRSVSINELFARQRDAFGLEAIHLPILPVELSAEGGSAAMRIVSAPFMACPTMAPGESYSVPIVQRAAAKGMNVGQAVPTP